MGRRKLPKTTKRTVEFRMKMTSDERTELHRVARRAGYPTAAAFVRAMAGLVSTGWGAASQGVSEEKRDLQKEGGEPPKGGSA